MDDEDDIDNLFKSTTHHDMSRHISSDSKSASLSSIEETPMESPEQSAESLIPLRSRSKVSAAKRFMKHRKIVSAPYSRVRHREESRHTEGATEQSILAELRKTNKQLRTLATKVKKSNQKINKIEKGLHGGSSSGSSSSSPLSSAERKKKPFTSSMWNQGKKIISYAELYIAQ